MWGVAQIGPGLTSYVCCGVIDLNLLEGAALWYFSGGSTIWVECIIPLELRVIFPLESEALSHSVFDTNIDLASSSSSSSSFDLLSNFYLYVDISFFLFQTAF